MADIKWSAFPTVASPTSGDTLVGLHSGANYQFTGLTIPFSPAVGGTGTSTAPSAGQILIGTTPGVYIPAAINSGTNITVGNGSGSITVSVSGVISPTLGGTGVNNGVKTITLGGNLATSGTFASTFTMTGATSVTFPTSGTLATTAQLAGAVLLAPSGAQTITGFGLTAPSFSTTNLTIGTTASTIASTNTNGNIIITPNGSGEVLIGIGTPVTVSAGYFTQITNNLSTGNSLLVSSFTNLPVSGGIYGALKSRSTVVNSFVALQANDVIGGFVGYGDTGFTYRSCGGMILACAASPSSGIMPTQLTLSTQNTSGSTTTALTISDAQVVTLANALPGASGGTGVANTGLTINLASGAAGKILTSDSSGNATWASPGYLTGAVLLAPSGNQTIASNDLYLTLGAVHSGSTAGGINGNFVAYPTTAASGYLEFGCQTNIAGNFYTLIVNASSIGQSQAIAIPDSGSAGASFILSSGSSQTIANGLTITTPKISQINDTNGNAMFSMITEATAVNHWNIYNSSAGSGLILQALGTDTDIAVGIYSKGSGIVNINSLGSTNQIQFTTGGGGVHTSLFNFPITSASQIYTFPDDTGTLLMTGVAISSVPSIAFSSTSGVIGTTTNDSAAAGSVGEEVESVITLASGGVSLTNATSADITSISLTAGDWDVWGNIGVSGNGATTVVYVYGWINSTSASTPDAAYQTQWAQAAGAAIFNAGNLGFPVPGRRFSLSGTTTIYLSVNSQFAVSTEVAFGGIYARRRR